MYRKRRPEDVAHDNTASNTTLSSTPAQSVSPLLPSQRPTYGSVDSIDDTDHVAHAPMPPPKGGDSASVGATTTASVETYKQVSEGEEKEK